MDMSEATFTYRLTSALRKKLPDATVIKLADAYTAGLPDFFLCHLGVTTFFEVKLTTNREIFRPLQVKMLERLGRGGYVIWDEKTKRGDVFWHEDKDYSLIFPFDEMIQMIVAMDSEER